MLANLHNLLCFNRVAELLYLLLIIPILSYDLWIICTSTRGNIYIVAQTEIQNNNIQRKLFVILLHSCLHLFHR